MIINKDDKNPNFKILLTKKAHCKLAINRYTNIKIKNLDTQSNCLLNFKHNKKSELTNALVIISVDHAILLWFIARLVLLRN